jgi:hypothetical protein
MTEFGFAVGRRISIFHDAALLSVARSAAHH